MTISIVNGVNPLQTTLLQLGIVSGRVALLLRSAEIHPLFERFVRWISVHPPPLLSPPDSDTLEGADRSEGGVRRLPEPKSCTQVKPGRPALLACY